jgi:hypothetical protein
MNIEMSACAKFCTSWEKIDRRSRVYLGHAYVHFISKTNFLYPPRRLAEREAASLPEFNSEDAA